MRAVVVVMAVLLASAVGGCGGAQRAAHSAAAVTSTSAAARGPGLPAVCAAGARAYLERALGTPVRGVVGESGQATPQCVFRAGRGRRAVHVTVVVDSFAQPYQRLERTQIEAGQQFGTRRLESLPSPVAHVGIDAYWFPTERKLMTTEGRRLISVFVGGRGLPTRQLRATAIAVARRYLGPNDPKAADPTGT